MKNKKNAFILTILLILAASVLLICFVYLPSQRRKQMTPAASSGVPAEASSSAETSPSAAASSGSAASASAASAGDSAGGRTYHTCWVAGGQGVFPYALPKPVSLQSGTITSKEIDLDSDGQNELVTVSVNGDPVPDTSENGGGDFYGTQLYKFSVGITVGEAGGNTWSKAAEAEIPISWFEMDNARFDFFAGCDGRIYLEEYISQNFIEDGCRWRLQAYSYDGAGLQSVLLDRDNLQYGTVLACGNDGFFSLLGDMASLKAYSDKDYEDFEKAAGKSEGFYDKLAGCGFRLTGITRETGIMDQDPSLTKLARIEAVSSFRDEEYNTFYEQDSNPDFSGTSFGDIEIKTESE